LNLRELGTGYCPVLLSFASLLFLGSLALYSSGPALHLAVSGSNQSTLDAFAAPDLGPNHPANHVDLSQLPLSFEPNQGQTDPQVKFLARGAGYGVFLTADQAVLTLSSDKNSPVVRMRLAGANPAAAASGSSPLPGKSNYFIGNDPAKWHSGVPQFARVRYQGVYPGVDLVYYGNHGRLEYDFEVAPGADPRQIALRFQGRERAKLDAGGNLILASGGHEVSLKAPRIYQEFGAEQRPVAGRFVLRQDGKVGFELAAYDRRRALVIDPELTYSTWLGGSALESCSAILLVASPPSGCPAIAIDPSSNIYIAGSTTSADFPGVPPLPTPPSAPNVFVTKLNATGSTILFSTYLGGNNVDYTAGVAVDTAFDVVVAGTTASSDFPVSTSSAFQATPTNGNQHAFVSVLSSTGQNLLYSTYLSGNGAESARGLALDPRNKIYVIGTTTSKDQPDATHSFPATLGAIQVASLGNSQFFVSKIDPTLVGFPSLVYSTYFGGGNPIDGLTLGGGIAVDANSNVYITGGTNFQHTGSPATDFPILNAFQGCLDTPSTSTTPTTNCVTPASPIPADAFVAKINPAAAAGAQLLYSTYLGGTGNDVGFGIAVDSGLSAYITGSTTSTDVTIPSGTTPFQRCLDNPANPSPCPAATASDAFVGKFGTPCNGSTCTTTAVPFTYFSYLGGSGTDVGLGIAVDSLQGARIAGWTNSTDFPGATNANNLVQMALGGLVDAFASRIDTTASSTVALGHYGTFLGGTANDFGTGIATDAQGSSYIVGETASGNFPKANPIQPAINGLSDAFITKLGPVLSLTVTEVVSPTTVGVGNNTTFTYTITNNGDLTTGIIFTDVLPSTATFVSANATPGQSNCPAPTSSIVTCTVGTLNGGASGTVTVVLTPTLPALPFQPGSVSDGGKVSIFGTSKVFTPAVPPVAAVNNFSVSVSPTTATVAAGIPASFTVTVTPTGNIPNTVSLSASGAPASGTTTFPNGTSFTDLSSGPQSRQLVVNTTARVTTPASIFPVGRPFYAALLPVSGLALLGAGIGGRKSLRRRVLMTALLGCFFTLVLFQAACGSKSTTSTTSGTPAGTYNLTVTATSGAASRTQQIVLVVQ
jgi:uncharacterized repeat protein (TIGR01451 family)